MLDPSRPFVATVREPHRSREFVPAVTVVRRLRLRGPALRRAVHPVRAGAVLVGRPGARGQGQARAARGARYLVEPGDAASDCALQEARLRDPVPRGAPPDQLHRQSDTGTRSARDPQPLAGLQSRNGNSAARRSITSARTSRVTLPANSAWRDRQSTLLTWSAQDAPLPGGRSDGSATSNG